MAVENQAGRDNTMPQRVMGYEYSAYEEQIKKLMDKNKTEGHPAITKRIHDDQKLAPVITIVLSWSDEEWQKPLHLHDMLEFPSDIEEVIKPYVSDYQVNLFQMTKLSEEERKRFTSDFGLLAEYIALRKEPDKIEDFIQKSKQIIRHPAEFLDVLKAFTGDKRYQSIENQIIEKVERGEEVTMYTFEDMVENRGIEKGIQAGIQTGILSVLEDCGTVTSEIKGRILAEHDPELLKKWLKTAARVESIQDFAEKM